MTIEKLDKRIEELKAANGEDRERLGQLDKEYAEAVTNFDTKRIDSLEGEMAAINSTVETRVKQIAILVSPDNPLRVKEQAERFKKAENRFHKVKGQADKLSSEIAKAQKEYTELANQIYAVNKEYNEARREYKVASGDRSAFYPSPYLIPARCEISTTQSRDQKEIYFQGGYQ